MGTLPPHRSIVAVLALFFGAGCGSPRKAPADAGVSADVERAEKLVASDTLPPRPEVIAAAQSVEALALREGAGARATQLHALAATLLERIWRVEHREQDAKEAIDLYRA